MKSACSLSDRTAVRWSIALLLILSTILSLSGCRDNSQTKLEYAPQMYRSPAYKAQRYDPDAPTLSTMRTPPVGAVPVNFEPYRLTLADSALQDQMLNPLPRTEEVLNIGRKYYNIYCIVCHGPKGDGMGYIVPKGLPVPPSYITGATRQWGDGRIFHLITRGRGNMSSYAAQLNPEQRWAVVHYIRALQRAGNPSDADLQKFRSSGFDAKNDLPDTSIVTTIADK